MSVVIEISQLPVVHIGKQRLSSIMWTLKQTQIISVGIAEPLLTDRIYPREEIKSWPGINDEHAQMG